MPKSFTFEDVAPKTFSFEDALPAPVDDGSRLNLDPNLGKIPSRSGEMSTTYGGGRAPLASYGETAESIQSDAPNKFEEMAAPRAIMQEPRAQFPTKLEFPWGTLSTDVQSDDSIPSTLVKEGYNIAKGIPEFFTSDLGIATMVAGPIAPRLMAAGFTADMIKSAFEQAKDTYENWDKLTPALKTKAGMDILATMVMGTETGFHAAGKKSPIQRLVTPKPQVQGPLATGAILDRPKGAEPSPETQALGAVAPGIDLQGTSPSPADVEKSLSAAQELLAAPEQPPVKIKFDRNASAGLNLNTGGELKINTATKNPDPVWQSVVDDENLPTDLRKLARKAVNGTATPDEVKQLSDWHGALVRANHLSPTDPTPTKAPKVTPEVTPKVTPPPATAIRDTTTGEVTTAPAGTPHDAVVAAAGKPESEVERGFVQPGTGEFSTREEAAKAHPEIPTTEEPGKLHSQDVKKAATPAEPLGKTEELPKAAAAALEPAQEPPVAPPAGDQIDWKKELSDTVNDLRHKITDRQELQDAIASVKSQILSKAWKKGVLFESQAAPKTADAELAFLRRRMSVLDPIVSDKTRAEKRNRERLIEEHGMEWMDRMDDLHESTADRIKHLEENLVRARRGEPPEKYVPVEPKRLRDGSLQRIKDLFDDLFDYSAPHEMNERQLERFVTAYNDLLKNARTLKLDVKPAADGSISSKAKVIVDIHRQIRDKYSEEARHFSYPSEEFTGHLPPEPEPVEESTPSPAAKALEPEPAPESKSSVSSEVEELSKPKPEPEPAPVAKNVIAEHAEPTPVPKDIENLGNATTEEQARANVAKLEQLLEKAENDRIHYQVKLKDLGRDPKSKEYQDANDAHYNLTVLTRQIAQALSSAKNGLIDIRIENEFGPLRGKAEPKFGKPTITTKQLQTQKKNLLYQLSDAIKAAPEKGNDHITIDVPGDGSFTLTNTKDSLRKFSEKADNEFPSKVDSHRESKPGSDAMVKVSEPKVEDLPKIAGKFTSKDPDREAITVAYADGTQIVSTDGSQMLRIVTDKAPGKPHAPVRLNSKGETTSSPGKFAGFNTILSSKFDLIKGGAKTADLLHIAEQAKVLKDQSPIIKNGKKEKSTASLDIVINRDGTIGGRMSVENGDRFEHNVKEGATTIGSYNPDYIVDGMTAARRLGNETVDIYASGESGPLRFNGKNHEQLVMPVRVGESNDFRPHPARFTPGKPDHGTQPIGIDSIASPDEKITKMTDDGWRVHLENGDITVERTIDKQVRHMGSMKADDLPEARKDRLQSVNKMLDFDKTSDATKNVLKSIEDALKEREDIRTELARREASQKGPGMVGMGGALAGEVDTGHGADIHGINAAVRKARAEAGVGPEEEAGIGTTWQEQVKLGRHLIDVEGADPEAVMRRFESSQSLNDAMIAIIRAHGEDLIQIARRIESKFGTTSPEFVQALKASLDWERRSKPMATKAHKIFTTFQGATDVDTGDFISMAHDYMARTGKEFTPEQVKRATELAGKVTKAEKEVQEVQAKLKAAIDALAKEQAAKAATPPPPKFHPSILEKAREIVDQMKVRADAARGRLAGKMFAIGDPQVLADLVEIGAYHLANGALEFVEWSTKMRDDIGDRIKPHLKQVWEASKARMEDTLKNTHTEVKKAVKTGATKKATPPTTGTTPKAAPAPEPTPKDILMAHPPGKTFTNEELSALWKHISENYAKQDDPSAVVQGVANDTGLTAAEVRKAIAQNREVKRITDEVYRKMATSRHLKNTARSWIRNEATPGWQKFAEKIPRVFFMDKIFGHGAVGMITHAGVNLFDPASWKTYFPAFLQQYKFLTDKGYHEQAMHDLLHDDPNYVTARRAGLVNDPFHYNDDFQNQVVGKWLEPFVGGRGFDALKTFRQARFNQIWDGLSSELKTPDMAKAIANGINHATGTVNKRFGNLPSTFLFAPKLEASRWAFMFGDPARAVKYASDWKNSTPAQRRFALSEFRQKATIVGVYASLLALNQGILSFTGSKEQVNTTDPFRGDFMAFKGFGHTLSVISPLLSTYRLLAKMLNITAGDRKTPREKMSSRQDRFGQALWEYGRSKASPFAGTAVDALTSVNYQGRSMPWVKKDETPAYLKRRGLKQYTAKEWAEETLAPIPIEEAIKEVWIDQGMGEDKATALLKGLIVFGVAGGTGLRVQHDFYSQHGAPQRR